MIKQITDLVKDKYEIIQNETIFRMFRFAVVLSTVIYIISIMTSIYTTAYKINFVCIISVIGAFSYISILLIKKYVNTSKKQLRWLFFVIIIYTLFSAFTSPAKYMTTNGLGVMYFSLLVFMMFSSKLLIIQGIITVILFAGFSILGIGKTVELGMGYVVSSVGIYVILWITLLAGSQMVKKFRDIYHEQLFVLNSQNEELNALNEEYYATEEVLRFNMEHDALTGIMNWNGFIKRVNEMLKTENNYDFYVVYFDIDDFMYINNAFGYDFGDEVLKRLVIALKDKEETFQNLARGEGDSILFTFENGQVIQNVIDTLNVCFNSIYIKQAEVKIRGSVGITQASEESEAKQLVRDAEVTMYKVKEEKKSGYAIHDNGHVQHMDKQFRIFSNIDKGLEREEFYLLYQPKVDVINKRIIGFEALVRWESDELGTVYPNQFIGVAEHTGQIIKLGTYVMKGAMEFAQKAALINSEVIISINISSIQLMDEHFIDIVLETMKRTKVSVKNIAFEVTETAYIENLKQVNDVLKTINLMGIKLYLDDFGTGYSSLNYLNKLPIQILKIDKSFIDDIHLDSQASKLVHTILHMAKTMEIQCIAEGVEDKHQFEKLQEFGCEYIQGYLFDKPLSEKEAYNKLVYVYNN